VSLTKRFSVPGLIAAGVYLAIAIVVYILCSHSRPDAGYEYIPFQFLELPWGLLFQFAGYQQLASFPLNMLTIYCVLSWFLQRRKSAARDFSK
jgi:hypothetical protein